MDWQKWIGIFIIVIFVNSSISKEENKKDKTKQVTLKVSSPGCYENKITSVIVNGTEYTYGFDGITIVIIETEKFKVNIENINNEEVSVNATLKKYLAEQVKTPGSVVVFVTQDTCFDDFDLWFNVLKEVDGFHTDRFTYDDEEETAVVVGCYGHCPYVIEGKLPASKFGDEMETVGLEVTIGVNGFQPPGAVKSETPSKTVTVIVVVLCLVLFILVIVIVLYCIYKRTRKVPPCFHCCEIQFGGKEEEAEERMGLSVSVVDSEDQRNHYTPINSCLIQEDHSTYTTLEKKEIPKKPGNDHLQGNDYSQTDEYKQSENLYYSNKDTKNDNTKEIERQISNDLYEPIVVDENKTLLPKPSPREVVIDKGGGESVIYKTPSNASNYTDSNGNTLSPTDVFIDKGGGESVIYKTPSNASNEIPLHTAKKGDESVIYKTPSNASSNNQPSSKEEQHYQIPTQTEHDERVGGADLPASAGHGRSMFKRGERNSAAPYQTPTNNPPYQSENHIYSKPSNTVNGNLNPGVPHVAFKTSPGTSRRIFEQQQEDGNEDKGEFASYVKLDEKDTLYKTPSNVLKHDPPKGSAPQNIYHTPTNATDSEFNIYDPVEVQDGRPNSVDNEDTNYENLSFLDK